MGAILDRLSDLKYGLADLTGDGILNKPLLAASCFAGIVSWLADICLYQLLSTSVAKPVLIGILFAVLSVIVCLCIVSLGKKMNTFEADIVSGKRSRPRMVAMLVLGTVLLFGLAVLFEWLYEIEIENEAYLPTSYLFVIDDSGSMASNDPEQNRFSAIDAILDGMDTAFPYAVYCFSDDVECIRGMAPISAGHEELTGNADGETALKAAFDTVLGDYEAGIWDGGDHPRIILLSDGSPTDMLSFAPFPELNSLTRYGISVSTVGLGNDNASLMRRIANATGGAYMHSPDAASLAQTMASAAVLQAQRDLLSERFSKDYDWIYALTRPMFLFLLGLVIGILAAIAYGSYDATKTIVMTSAACAATGAVFMELGCGLLNLPAWLCWFALWILYAMTIATYPAVTIGSQRKRGRLSVLVPTPSWYVRSKRIKTPQDRSEN